MQICVRMSGCLCSFISGMLKAWCGTTTWCTQMQETCHHKTQQHDMTDTKPETPWKKIWHKLTRCIKTRMNQNANNSSRWQVMRDLWRQSEAIDDTAHDTTALRNDKARLGMAWHQNQRYTTRDRTLRVSTWCKTRQDFPSTTTQRSKTRTQKYPKACCTTWPDMRDPWSKQFSIRLHKLIYSSYDVAQPFCSSFDIVCVVFIHVWHAPAVSLSTSQVASILSRGEKCHT